jgi:hypothetical protein
MVMMNALEVSVALITHGSVAVKTAVTKSPFPNVVEVKILVLAPGTIALLTYH